VDRWRALRKKIHDEVCREAFNADIGAFVQSYGSKELDASVLLIPLVGFLPPTDPRVRSTVEAIERHLMVDGFVLRYDPSPAATVCPEGRVHSSLAASGLQTISCS
jgi:GH15 family glucan-1,4-alpha-glucosidase